MRQSVIVKSLFFALLLNINFEWTTGKVYTRCGLAKALIDNGFPRSFIGQCKFLCNYICLIIILLILMIECVNMFAYNI